MADKLGVLPIPDLIPKNFGDDMGAGDWELYESDGLALDLQFH